MTETKTQTLFPALESYAEARLQEQSLITEDRLPILNSLIDYINSKEAKAELLFVCIHNSRRSFFGQIWAQTAAHYFGFDQIKCFSGGTEVTQIHPNTVATLKSIGFQIEKEDKTENPEHKIAFSKDASPCLCFSKMYDDASNPQSDFAAIMTCSPAETECPFIPGADFRLAMTYEDPKISDGTPAQEATYLERSADVARELFYVFSKVNK